MQRNAFTVLFGVALAALAGEALLQAFWPQRSMVTTGMFEPDPAAGYRIRSNYRNEIRVPEYRTQILTDGDGFRVPVERSAPAQECRRILAIGDSFTFGVGVEAEEAFPVLLEKGFSQKTNEPWCARNGGVGGYGPLRSARLLLSTSPAPPEILVHAIYVGNDLEDSNPSTLLLQPKIEGGRMVAQDAGVIRRARRFLRIHSHLYSFLRASLYDLYLSTPLAAKSQVLDPIGLVEWPARIRERTWPAGADAIREIAAWCSANGARYLVVLVPTKYQVEDAAWDAYRRRWNLQESAFQRDHAQIFLGDFLRAEGVAALDLLPALRAGAERGEHYYFRMDNHWTAAGHALAAEKIAEEAWALGWLEARGAAFAGGSADLTSRRDLVGGLGAGRN
jgi:hypothetical protein